MTLLNWAWYKKRTAAQIKGMTVYSLETLKNNYVELPAGTKYTILGKARGGLNIKAVPCEHCGAGWVWHGIAPSSVVTEREAWMRGLIDEKPEGLQVVMVGKDGER